ncbi:unnamed protein product [Prunus brigantina]
MGVVIYHLQFILPCCYPVLSQLHPAAPEAREAVPSFNPLTLDQTSCVDWVQEKYVPSHFIEALKRVNRNGRLGNPQSGWETVSLCTSCIYSYG